MMVITTAMDPGTRKLRLTSAGLNQARLSTATGKENPSLASHPCQIPCT